MKHNKMSSLIRLQSIYLVIIFTVTIVLQVAVAQNLPSDDQPGDEVENAVEAPSEAESTDETAAAPSQEPASDVKPATLDTESKVLAKEEAAPEIPFTPKGADTCLKCHDETSEFPVMSIFKTKHARISDKRTPFAQLQCESCHGPGGEHAKRLRRGQERPPIINFGQDTATPVADQNEICLGCHQTYSRKGWHGSVHEQNDVACASCHSIHAHRDPVFITSEQPEVCFKCHKKERAEIYKASAHPIRYGKMSCSDCHQPHDSDAPALLIRPTLNETCYTCHAEKRGPYLWEHVPAAEDCSLCHNPHGSNHLALLNKRAPLLCQDCHSRLGHPSVQRTAAGLPGSNPSGYLLSGSCMNCHSQVHGSNHPSGSSLNR